MSRRSRRQTHRLTMLGLVIFAGFSAVACSDTVTTRKNKAKPQTEAEPWAESEEDEYWEPEAESPPRDGGVLVVQPPGDAGAFEAGPAATRSFVVYSAPLPVGIDHRADVEAAFDAQHALKGYIYDAREAPMRGSLTTQNIGWRTVPSPNTSYMGIGRWLGGKSSPTFYGTSIELTAEQGFHYAAGSIAESLPSSGDEPYLASVAGTTVPTSDDGTLGTSSMSTPKGKVRFGATTRVALSFGLAAGGASYSVATAGGLNDPSQSEVQTYSSPTSEHVFGGVVPVTGTGCGGSCTAIVRGFFSGKRGETLAFAYVIASGTPKAIRGVVVLAR